MTGGDWAHAHWGSVGIQGGTLVHEISVHAYLDLVPLVYPSAEPLCM